MCYPVRLDRDAAFASSWDDNPGGFASVGTALNANTLNVRSDGTVSEFKSVLVRATQAVGIRQAHCVGVHLFGPSVDVEIQDNYIAYGYECHAQSFDVNVVPALVCLVSPAAVTANATGDACTNPHYLGFGVKSETGNVLDTRGVFAVPKTDVVAANRGVCFAVAMMTGAVAGGATEPHLVRLSVRRLVKPGPIILDGNKLG